MRQSLGFLVLPCLLALPLIAQDTPRVEVFGGYQYLHAGNIDSFGHGANTNGWDTAATVNLNSYLGVTADFSGSYKTANVPGPFGGSNSFQAHVRVYTYTFGPVVSLNSGGTLKPFAHVLFGGAHLRPNGCVIFSGSPDECGSGSYSGFAMMLGGGIDVKAGKSVAIRLVQFDWAHLPSGGGGGNNGVRVSTGLVFRF